MAYLTLANQLTILRVALTPLFVLAVVYGYLGTALVVFLMAGATDALDGLIARRTGQRPAWARGSIRWPTSSCWSPRSSS